MIKSDNDGGWNYEIDRIYRSKKRADEYVKSKSRVRNYDYFVEEFDVEE